MKSFTIRMVYLQNMSNVRYQYNSRINYLLIGLIFTRRFFAKKGEESWIGEFNFAKFNPMKVSALITPPAKNIANKSQRKKEPRLSGKTMVGEKFSHFAKNSVTTLLKLTRGVYKSIPENISHLPPTLYWFIPCDILFLFSIIQVVNLLPKDWFDKNSDNVIGGLQAVARYLVGLASTAHANSLGYDENYRKRIRYSSCCISSKSKSYMKFATSYDHDPGR